MLIWYNLVSNEFGRFFLMMIYLANNFNVTYMGLKIMKVEDLHN